MIQYNAALPVVFGERLLVLPLEQRRVAGREPPSERRSEGQPGYSGASRRHLRRHRAPITATRPMDIFLATGIQVTVIPPIDIHPLRSPAMDIQAIPVLPLIRVHQPTGTRAMQDTPVILLRRATDTKAAKDTPLNPVPRPMNTMAMQDTQPTRQTIGPKATEHTRPTLVPPAMKTRSTWEKPRCRRLQAMNTRTRRRLPLTRFPIIDHRRSSSALLAPRLTVKNRSATPYFPDASKTARELGTGGTAMTKILDEVLAANAKYAETFGDKGNLPLPPSRRFAILTCMDARLDPAKYAGLAEGDAHVIRNAGGRASDDAIRSLVISYKLLGTREWFVIHHTDCGMLLFTNDDMRRLLASSLKTATVDQSGWHDAGQGPGSTEGSYMNWLTFSDNAKSVVEDVVRIRNHSLVHNDIPIYGYIYDVKSGKLVEVPEATTAGKAG